MAEIPSKRFGESSIDKIIEQREPKNTKNTWRTVWNQFQQFCNERGYGLTKETPTQQIGTILADWAINMRRSNGGEYKENTVKTMWNVTAKIIQEKYFAEYQRKFNPFSDQEFKRARDARKTKRKNFRQYRRKERSPIGQSEMGTLACPLCCDNRFSNTLSLKHHLLEIESKIQCPDCCERFHSILELANHLGGQCWKPTEVIEIKNEVLDTKEFSERVYKSEDGQIAGNIADDSNSRVQEVESVISGLAEESTSQMAIDPLDNMAVMIKPEVDSDSEDSLSFKAEMDVENIEECKIDEPSSHQHPQPGPSSARPNRGPRARNVMETPNGTENSVCAVCSLDFEHDLRNSTGAQWIQCCFCLKWYHNKCEGLGDNFDEVPDVLMCSSCER